MAKMLEKIYYESRPYVFAALAGSLIFNPSYDSQLMKCSCILMLAMTSLIIAARWNYRAKIVNRNF